MNKIVEDLREWHKDVTARRVDDVTFPRYELSPGGAGSLLAYIDELERRAGEQMATNEGKYDDGLS